MMLLSIRSLNKIRSQYTMMLLSIRSLNKIRYTMMLLSITR